MPKAPASGEQSINSLSRNQACHRLSMTSPVPKKEVGFILEMVKQTMHPWEKLETNNPSLSDAAQPCGPCARSHAYAVKHNGLGALEPIECLYDSLEDATSFKEKMESLKVEVARLREALREKDAELALCVCGRKGVSSSSASTDVEPEGTIALHFPVAPFGQTPRLPSPNRVDANTISAWEEATEVTASNVGQGTDSHRLSAPVFRPSFPEFDPLNFRVMNVLWPLNLPPPDVLQHLAETFFASVPLATRLIHKPTFMAGLQQPPTSLSFPQVSLLHAICAMGSLYTPMEKDYVQNLDIGEGHSYFFNSALMPYATDGPFTQGTQYVPLKLGDIDMNPQPSFGVAQIRWAGRALAYATHLADRLIQVVQGAIICAWYQYSTGMDLDLQWWLGIVGRSMVPLGFHTSLGFEPLSRLPLNQLMLLPGPWKRPFHEVPRNVYWMAFASERVLTLTQAWPLLICEEDSSQTMPVTFFDFVSLKDVPMEGRQRIITPGFFDTHPARMTDSFTLYIKASVLAGRVKTFNGRFRMRYSTDGALDPRETTEFQTLDASILNYLETIPKEFRDPIHPGEGGKLDPVLYLAHCLPHTAMIMLHDPHADLTSPTCVSAKRILTAARAILDLIYKLCSTSYDLIYLDHSCSISWLVAGVAIVRLLKAMVTIGKVEEALQLKQEFEVVRLMLISLGQRTTIGKRQIKLLDHFCSFELGAVAADAAHARARREGFVDDQIVLEQ